MSLKKIISSTVKYGLVFALGYWAGGGCDHLEHQSELRQPYNTDSQIEKKLTQNSSRSYYLGSKLDKEDH